MSTNFTKNAEIFVHIFLASCLILARANIKQESENVIKYQPSNEGGTRFPPATCNATLPAIPHCILNPQWPTGSGNMSNPKFLDQSQ